MRRALRNMMGAGDLVEAITTATGIKKIADSVAKATGKPCGCGRRRDKLNKLMPFRGGQDGVQSDETGTQQH